MLQMEGYGSEETLNFAGVFLNIQLDSKEGLPGADLQMDGEGCRKADFVFFSKYLYPDIYIQISISR
ncbi:hypothetical protein BTA51_09720 [Hahella sp. CCB-MM4]|nr:hypothetical protein BTA51_09720 [Hahella sp. CCB-MM4]